MRQAECLGLTWDAVDLDNGTLDVSWQLQALPWQDRTRGAFRVPAGFFARHLTGSYHLSAPRLLPGVT